MTVAVDSSALMALVRGEAGAAAVAAELHHARASPVIFAETLGKCSKLGFNAVDIADGLTAGGLTIDVLTASEAARLAAVFPVPPRGISLADRFAMVHALERDLPLITDDRAWQSLGLPLKLIYFR